MISINYYSTINCIYRKSLLSDNTDVSNVNTNPFTFTDRSIEIIFQVFASILKLNIIDINIEFIIFSILKFNIGINFTADSEYIYYINN